MEDFDIESEKILAVGVQLCGSYTPRLVPFEFEVALIVDGVRKTEHQGGGSVHVLNGLSTDFRLAGSIIQMTHFGFLSSSPGLP